MAKENFKVKQGKKHHSKAQPKLKNNPGGDDETYGWFCCAFNLWCCNDGRNHPREYPNKPNPPY